LRSERPANGGGADQPARPLWNFAAGSTHRANFRNAITIHIRKRLAKNKLFCFLLENQNIFAGNRINTNAGAFSKINSQSVLFEQKLLSAAAEVAEAAVGQRFREGKERGFEHAPRNKPERGGEQQSSFF